ncbi:MAG TPA: hypothetical protein GXX72_07520 [Clostridiaceae bacterium]|nr:hypothetical protein [Clostridiaceae bacterium]
MQYPLYLAVTIDLTDLLLAILILSGAAALIALATVLFKAAQNLSETKLLLKENREDINKIVEQLPDLVEKVDAVLEDASFITDQAGESVPGIIEDVEVVTGAAANVVDTVSTAAVGILDSVQSFFHKKSKSKSGTSSVQKVVAAVNAIKKINSILKKKKSSKKKKSKKSKKKFF